MYSFYKLMPPLLKPDLKLILHLAADFKDFFFQKTKQSVLSVIVLWVTDAFKCYRNPSNPERNFMLKMYHITSFFVCSKIILLFDTDIVLITATHDYSVAWNEPFIFYCETTYFLVLICGLSCSSTNMYYSLLETDTI